MTVIDRDYTLFQRWDSGLRTFFPFLVRIVVHITHHLPIPHYCIFFAYYAIPTHWSTRREGVNKHSYILLILSKWFYSVVFGLGLWHIMKHLCTQVLHQIITMQPMEVYLNIVNRVSLEIMNKEYGVHFNRVCFMFSSTLHLQL